MPSNSEMQIISTSVPESLHDNFRRSITTTGMLLYYLKIYLQV